MSYEPQPGTIPAKVIEYLRAQPEGFTIATAPLLEAIGQPGVNPLQSYVRPALAAGIIAFEKEPGRAHGVWRLGDGVPVARPQDEPGDEDGGSPLVSWMPAPQKSEAAEKKAPRPRPVKQADLDPAQQPRLPREDAADEWARLKHGGPDCPTVDEIRRFGTGFGIGVAVRLAERALHADPETAKALLVDAGITLCRAATTINADPAKGDAA